MVNISELQEVLSSIIEEESKYLPLEPIIGGFSELKGGFKIMGVSFIVNYSPSRNEFQFLREGKSRYLFISALKLSGVRDNNYESLRKWVNSVIKTVFKRQYFDRRRFKV